MEHRQYRHIRKLRTGLQTLASSTDHQTGGQFASKSIPQQERIPTMMSTAKELEEASAVVITHAQCQGVQEAKLASLAAELGT